MKSRIIRIYMLYYFAVGRSDEYALWSRCVFHFRLEYYGRISRYHFHNRSIDVVDFIE